MESLNTAIMTALLADSTISGIVTNRIYYMHPQDFTSLPAISYLEEENAGNLYADDVEVGSRIVIKIDLWSKTSHTALAKAVDDVMVSIEFVRMPSGGDQYEEDTGIYHKSMRYKQDYKDPTF